MPDENELFAEEQFTTDAPSPIVRIGGGRNVSKTAVQEKIRNKIRFHNTTFQARLGQKLDAIQRQVLDNNIRLSSHPTDMLRIKAERDPRSQDLVSRTIEAAEVLPIILPPLKDIPLRYFEKEGEDITITSLYTINQQEYFEIYAPVEAQLNMDDLLVRIMYDPNSDRPYIMILQVTEMLGTFGYSSLTYMKYFVTFYNEKLPQKVIDIIKEQDQKRLILGW